MHCQHDDVAAQHGEAAVCEVDEAHQSHGDREANRDDEQDHARGEPAKENADRIHEKNRRPSGCRRRRGVTEQRGAARVRYLQRPSCSSLHMSFTALITPMFFCTRWPPVFTTSLRYSFITM